MTATGSGPGSLCEKVRGVCMNPESDPLTLEVTLTFSL